MFVGSVSTTVRTNIDFTFNITNLKPSALELLKEGLIEEGKQKEYINNTSLTDINISAFLNKVVFVVDDGKMPSEYVKAIIKQHPNIIPEEKVLNAIFNEIRDAQSSKKNINVVEGVIIETSDEALNYCRHLTSNEIRLMTLQRIINRDPLSRGIPLSFIDIYNTWPPEKQKDMFEDCQRSVCSALFNKNAADAFWYLFENIYQLVVHYPNESIQQLFVRLRAIPNCMDRCHDFDALSLKFFISEIKDGIQQ